MPTTSRSKTSSSRKSSSAAAAIKSPRQLLNPRGAEFFRERMGAVVRREIARDLCVAHRRIPSRQVVLIDKPRAHAFDEIRALAEANRHVPLAQENIFQRQRRRAPELLEDNPDGRRRGRGVAADRALDHRIIAFPIPKVAVNLLDRRSIDEALDSLAALP